eukprot:gene6088-6705_t
MLSSSSSTSTTSSFVNRKHRLVVSRLRVFIGPHWPGILVTIVILLGGSMINVDEVRRSVRLSSQAKQLLFLAIALLAPATLLLLLLTALSDPGIVFPSQHTQDSTSESEGLLADESAGGGGGVAGAGGERFFCEDCQLVEPAGVSRMDHCRLCGYCIEGLDHHCPWMGQCIGKKNMR